VRLCPVNYLKVSSMDIEIIEVENMYQCFALLRNKAVEGFVLFENKEGTIEIKSEDPLVKLIVLSGEPLNEPQVGSGPFVMNTMEEIRQASLDYREGRFGTDKF